MSARFSMAPLIVTGILCMGAMMGFATVAGPIVRGLGLADWHAGLIMTTSGLLWVILAPTWGRLSDLAGRKPILLIGVGGFALAYLGQAVFVNAAMAAPPAMLISLVALLCARGLIGGFYAAVPPVSAAYIADNVPAADRAAHMARLGAASGVGMVGGPLVAGILSGWGLALPLYLFAILPVLAMVLLWRGLPRVRVVPTDQRPALRIGDSRLRLPVLAAFASTYMVAAAQICVGFLMIDRLGVGLEEGARFAGMALGGVGISLIVTQLIVASRAGIVPVTWMWWGAATGLCACLLIAVAGNAPMLIGAFCLSAIGMGMIFPSFQAIAANAVGPQEQGAAAGTVSAAQGFAMVIGPVAAALLYGWHSGLPFAAAAALLLALLIVSWRERRRVSRQSQSAPAV